MPGLQVSKASMSAAQHAKDLRNNSCCVKLLVVTTSQPVSVITVVASSIDVLQSCSSARIGGSVSHPLNK